MLFVFDFQIEDAAVTLKQGNVDLDFDRTWKNEENSVAADTLTSKNSEANISFSDYNPTKIRCKQLEIIDNAQIECIIYEF